MDSLKCEGKSSAAVNISWSDESWRGWISLRNDDRAPLLKKVTTLLPFGSFTDKDFRKFSLRGTLQIFHDEKHDKKQRKNSCGASATILLLNSGRSGGPNDGSDHAILIRAGRKMAKAG